jgi:hypothetical protein
MIVVPCLLDDEYEYSPMARADHLITWDICYMSEMFQRRTQKGMGRTEKTAPGTAKNPRLLKACNITKIGDMGEFFFISNDYKIVVEFYCNAKKNNFLGIRADLSLIFL